MKSELISQINGMYNVVFCEDNTLMVEANRKYDYSFKTTIENICKNVSEKTGYGYSILFDINDRKIFNATIKTNLPKSCDTMEELMENLKETVESWTDVYCIGYEKELEQIIIEVPPLREDPYGLQTLKNAFNKLDFFNGGENLGAILDGPYNDFILYPNLNALKIDENKNYIICDGDYEY